TWYNLQLESLNADIHSGSKKKNAQNQYHIKIPAPYTGDPNDIYKITAGKEVTIVKEAVEMNVSLINIEKEKETFLVVVNERKKAAMVARNRASDETAPKTNKLSKAEAKNISQAILTRREKLEPLKEANKSIIVRAELPRTSGTVAKETTPPVSAGTPESTTPAPQQPFVPRPQLKKELFNKIETYSKDLNSNNIRETVKLLKLGSIKKARQYLDLAIKKHGAKKPELQLLLDKLSTVDSGTKKIMRDAESYLKMDKAKAMQKTVVEIGPGTKESTLRKIFAAFQEILTNNAGRITFVEETLTKLPFLLQLEPAAAFTPTWTQERATLPNRALYCREGLKLFRANETHLDDAVFTQNGRTSRILNLLENIV
ncbi:MAG: hypothetical protein GY757_28355, partial [bacterium]|nr:hypothetical protein [bacterium]